MKHIRTCWIAIAIALVHPVKANEAHQSIPLIEDGVGRFSIVVPSGESEKALEAANLLKEILEKSTGAPVPIARESSGAGTVEIVVASEKVFPNPTPEEATKLTLNNQQWWSMKRDGNQIWLTGNDAGMRAGTRGAVVTFLEDVVGARFFHFGRNGQVIPESKSVVFSSPDKTIIPDSGYRALYPYHQGKIDTTSRDCTYERWIRWTHQPGVPIQHMHNMENIAPPHTYFEKHPEYYSEIRGVRTVSDPHGWQLCTSNPDVVKLAVEFCRRFLDSNPNQECVSISMNDSATFCDCEKCRIDGGSDPVTSNARKAILFANAVAEQLVETHPDRKVAFYAYHSLVNPPDDVKCHPSVVVVFADSHACAMHSLGDPTCGLATDSLNRLRRWADIAEHVVVYDYVGLTAGVSGVPHLNLERLSKNARLLKAMGVANITFDAMYVPGALGLHYYAAVRFAVDSEITPDEVIKDFCEKLYGPASETMQQYFRKLEEATTGAGVHSTWVTWTLSGPLFVWTDDLFKTLNSLLAKAASEVPKDSLFFSNINDQQRVVDLNYKFCAALKAQRVYWKSPKESAAQDYAPLRRSYLLALKQLENDNLISLGDHVINDNVPDVLSPLASSKKLVVIEKPTVFSDDFTSDIKAQITPPEAVAPWLVDDQNFWAYPITGAKAYADKDFIYFVVTSHTPETALLPKDSNTASPQLNLNETIVVSIADSDGLKPRWDYVVSPKGDLQALNNGGASKAPGVVAKVETANEVGNRKWTVYLRVPRVLFPKSKQSGEYRVNFQRMRPDAEIQKVQSWSPTFGKPGDAQFLGHLTIKKQ
jgi:Domain of unknown function (DUF4838)